VTRLLSLALYRYVLGLRTVSMERKAEPRLGLCVTKQLHGRGSDPTRLQAAASGYGARHPSSMLVVDRALSGTGLE
jgi:hypothetical protein